MNFITEVEDLDFVYPDYYKDFACTASRCKHNCCIGWEIDIDEKTAEYYAGVSGDMGKRLSDNISREGTPHFILGKDERCPFLNERNLCDIILTLGEESLCHICTEHPRFVNELPGRIEKGVGLCCEEAARLILGKREPTHLLGESATDDEIILLRNDALTVISDFDVPLEERTEKLCALCGIAISETDMLRWIKFLLMLERLDEEWTKVLLRAEKELPTTDFRAFDLHMQERGHEYGQFISYLIYRHTASAPDLDEACFRIAFACVSYRILRALGAVQYKTEGDFTFCDQQELARMFSAEIEYSEENREAMLDEIVDVATSVQYTL